MADPKRRPETNQETDLSDVAAGLGDDVTGASQWKRSKFGFLFGVDAIKAPFQDTYRIGAESIERTSDLAKKAFAPTRKGVSVDPSFTDPQERFAMAQKANRKSSSDIAVSIETTYKQFWLAMALAGFFLAAAIGSTAVFGFVFPSIWPLELLFRLSVIPLCLVVALRAGFTNWVFRSRSMRTIGEYLRSGEILPVRKLAAKGRNVAAAILLGILAFGSMPQEAHAAADNNAIVSGVLDTGETDLFNRLLSYVMPDVGPVMANDKVGNSPQFEAIRNGFFAFSATLLFLGSSLLGWQIISSLVASAKEGSMMGQKYHEIWAPIRTVIGFGMLAPIAGGLCAAQIIILYLAVWGGNLANIVWRPYVATLTLTQTDEASVLRNLSAMSAPQTMPTVKSVALHHLCAATAAEYFERNGWSNNGEYNLSPTFKPQMETNWLGYTTKVSTTVQTMNFGTYCGEITVSENTASGGGIKADGEVSYDDRIMAKHLRKAVEVSGNALSKESKSVAASYQASDAAVPRVLSKERAGQADGEYKKAISDAVKQFKENIANGAKEVYAQKNPNAAGSKQAQQLVAIKDGASESGWAGSGVYYITLARLQSQMYESAQKSVGIVEASDPASAFLEKYWIGGVEDDEIPGVSSDFQLWWNANNRGIGGDLFPAGSLNAASETTMVGDLLTEWVGAPLVGIFGAEDEGDRPLNPMQDMIDMGNKMIGVSTAIIVAQASAVGLAEGANDSMAAKWTPAGYGTTVLKSIVMSFATMALMIAYAVLAAGMIHAYVVPMVPYIMTVMFMVGMMVLVAESLVAAPIWAFLHIRLDGEEFMNQVQRPGYMIAFNLLLRPALMIFGLILSSILFGAMIFFINATFMPVVASYSASNGVGLFAAIAMIIIVTYLHFMMALRAYGLILKLPDRVARWFGQGGENLNEENDSEKTAGFVYSSTQRLEGMGKAGGMKPSGRLPKPDKGATETPGDDKADGKEGGDSAGGDAASKHSSPTKGGAEK